MALSRTATIQVVSRDVTSLCLKLVSFLRRCPVGDLTGATEIIYTGAAVLSRYGDEITPCRVYPSLWPHLLPAVKS